MEFQNYLLKIEELIGKSQEETDSFVLDSNFSNILAPGIKEDYPSLINGDMLHVSNNFQENVTANAANPRAITND